MQTLNTPVNSTDLTPKSYVDAAVGFPGICACFDPRTNYTILAFPAANRGLWVRILYCPIPMAITKVGLEVGTSSGNISVAAYQNSGTGPAAVPGVRLATSGAVACPAAGYQEVALGSSVTVRMGDWLFLSVDNTTATFARSPGSAQSALLNGWAWKKDSSHPAPASNPTSLTAGSSFVPYLLGIA